MLLAVMALFVALMAGTAAAKQNGKGKGNSGKGPAVVTYNFKGTLEEVDGDGPELDGDGTYVLVEVTGGNRAGRDAAEAYEQAHPGEPMSFVVDQNTDVEVDDTDAELSDLSVGDEVHVQTKTAKGETQFVARKLSAEHEEDSSDEEATP
jgi:hypothetical protein